MGAHRQIVLLIIFGFIACSPHPGTDGLLRFHDPALQLPHCVTATTISAEDLAKAVHVRIDRSGSYSWAATPGDAGATAEWSEPGGLTTLRKWLGQFEAIQDLVIWADETDEADPIARLVHVTARHPTNIARHQFAVQAPPTGPFLIQTLEFPVPKDPYEGTTGTTCFLFEKIDIRVTRASNASPAREDAGWDPNEVTLRVNGETLRWAPFLDLLRAFRKSAGPADPAEIDGLKASLEMHPTTTHADLIAIIHAVQSTGINDITLRANLDGVDVDPDPSTPEDPDERHKRSWPVAFRQRGESTGNPEADRAIASGLEWLQRHQEDSGFWSARHFSRHCPGPACGGAGDPSQDIRVTALALLAFSGAGDSITSGHHKQVVRKGAKYLHEIQDPETGFFGDIGFHPSALYSHVVATAAMVEIYGLSRWLLVRPTAQEGLDFIMSARNVDGAWGDAYPPTGIDDVSMTACVMMALVTAQNVGLEIDEGALRDGQRFLDDSTAYADPGAPMAPGKEAAWVAAALLCRIVTEPPPGYDPRLDRRADRIQASPPRWDESSGTIDFAYWFYGSHAVFQLGAERWDRWSPHLLEAVLPAQRTEGDLRGSWDPHPDPWGQYGGRVYATAMMILCLQSSTRWKRIVPD